MDERLAGKQDMAGMAMSTEGCENHAAQQPTRAGKLLIDLVKAHFDDLVDLAVRRILQEIPAYAAVDPEQLRANARLGTKGIVTDLETGDPQHFARAFYEVAIRRARQGLDVLDLNCVIAIAEQNICNLAARDVEDLHDRLAVISQCHEECDTGRIAIMRAFSEVTRALLHEADTLVEQMSSPILPVYPGTIVMPLVGAVNARRAGRIMEALLGGIVAHHASLVILDVTGIPAMDAVVAHSLAQTARACRLLGAQVIVVGVSPKVAQTMVELDADLSGTMTLMHLRAGLEYALRHSGGAAARISRA